MLFYLTPLIVPNEKEPYQIDSGFYLVRLLGIVLIVTQDVSYDGRSRLGTLWPRPVLYPL